MEWFDGRTFNGDVAAVSRSARLLAGARNLLSFIELQFIAAGESLSGRLKAARVVRLARTPGALGVSVCLFRQSRRWTKP